MQVLQIKIYNSVVTLSVEFYFELKYDFFKILVSTPVFL